MTEDTYAKKWTFARVNFGPLFQAFLSFGFWFNYSKPMFPLFFVGLELDKYKKCESVSNFEFLSVVVCSAPTIYTSLCKALEFNGKV